MRREITEFFSEFSQANDNILFDGTDLISNSKKMDITKISKSKRGTFDSIVNIMFIFSVGLQLPLYYRIMPGNIKDIKAFKLCLEESQIKDAVIIADKGFYSEKNIDKLIEEKLRFIIPLRRNNKKISYNKIKAVDKKSFDNFFKYENRIIWYYTIKQDSFNINVYLDEELKAEEIKDYLNRCETLPEKYNLDTFHRKQYKFGTIAIMNNLNKTAEEIYIDYKSRGQIETMIDTLKNIIDADRSYMQNEQSLEAWMFINHIALQWYYKIYQLLKMNNLNHKFSPMDLLLFLKDIKKVKINDKWHIAEITEKTSDVLDLLNLHIT
jgi:transposase